MNIKEFRKVMDSALAEEGLEHRRVLPMHPKVWSLPADDIIRFFQPGAHRRPWGFVYYGVISLEIPALRAWLIKHKPGDQAGIFRTYFTGYHTANDAVMNNFTVNFGDPLPADLWAGLIRDRLAQLPSSLDALTQTYRGNRDQLGWLAHPHQEHAWNFLLRWRENPDPALRVPKMSPNGQIV